MGRVWKTASKGLGDACLLFSSVWAGCDAHLVLLDFGSILEAKKEPTSIKNRFKIRSKFQSDFGVVPGAFLVNLGRILSTLRPQKWCSRVGAVLFLRKSRFSDQIRFWIDIFMIFDGLGDHFGGHFGIKIASKSRLKNQSDVGSILDGFWLPFWVHFGSILVSKIDQKSKSEKGRKSSMLVTQVLRALGRRFPLNPAGRQAPGDS